MNTYPESPSGKGSKWLIRILIVGLAIAYVLWEGGKFKLWEGSKFPPPEEALTLPGDSSGKMELRGLPRVEELPPVLPEARGRLSLGEVAGPRKPHIAWSVVMPFSPPTVLKAIGVDGTVYVAGYDGLGAVREGKLLWAYSAHIGSNLPAMDNDGRIWFPGTGESGNFCLNENGQGGMVPVSLRPPPDLEYQQPVVGCSEDGGWVRVVGRGDVPLEYECTDAHTVRAPDGMTYVGTTAPDIRAVTPEGAVAWKLATPCAARTLLVGSGGRVLFSCQDESLHYVEKCALKWSKPGDGKLQIGNIFFPESSTVAVMDRNGTSYFTDEPDNGGVTHIHALRSTGDMAWTIKIARATPSSMRFDGQGRLLLTVMGPDRVVCVCD